MTNSLDTVERPATNVATMPTSSSRRRSARESNRNASYEDEFTSLGVEFRYVASVELDDIERHPDSQARIRESGLPIVQQYARKMKEGQIYPPVTLWQDGSDGYFLVDGNTRVAAKRRNNMGTTDAYILELGDKDTAVAISASLNTLNGAQLNREELQRAMMAMTRVGLHNKTIARKLGIPAQQVTRALAAEEFDKRAATQWPVADDVKERLGRTMKARINTVADDKVFADLASLVVDAELGAKEVTPLLSSIKAAGSEAERIKVIADERINRAVDIDRVATGRTTKGTPILESTRAFGSLRKLMEDYQNPMQWVPASDEKRLEWMAVLDELVPFLERVRAVYAVSNGDHE